MLQLFIFSLNLRLTISWKVKIQWPKVTKSGTFNLTKTMRKFEPEYLWTCDILLWLFLWPLLSLNLLADSYISSAPKHFLRTHFNYVVSKFIILIFILILFHNFFSMYEFSLFSKNCIILDTKGVVFIFFFTLFLLISLWSSVHVLFQWFVFHFTYIFLRRFTL